MRAPFDGVRFHPVAAPLSVNGKVIITFPPPVIGGRLRTASSELDNAARAGVTETIRRHVFDNREGPRLRVLERPFCGHVPTGSIFSEEDITAKPT